jgi:alkyl hydroperoxide reductase subunit AhpF
MALLSPHDQSALKQRLAAITKPVTCLLFTQTFGGSDSGVAARQILGEVAALTDKVAIVERNFILDADDRAKYRVDKSPAIVILSEGEDHGLRMYGAPAGYEFVSLVEAILLSGTRELDLKPQTLAWIAKVDKPLHLQVFTTPT